MDDENIIYVDADTREAVLHSNFKIGVVNDDSCHTITFRINNASNIDLTDLTFYVNTTSSRGNGDRLDCTKEEDGQYIFIKCLLKGTIFEAKGKATINLCGRKYDSNNTIIKKWGSEDITVLVGSHTDADKVIEERYPSILEDLKSKIENLNITDAQINTIATKVAEKGFYTKTEIDSMISGIVVPTKLSQLEEDDSHVTVTRAQKTKIDDVPTSFKTINNQTITGTGNIDIPTGGTGLSTEAINKLEEVGNYLAYTTADGGVKWTELISILRNGSSGGGSEETEKTLSSISATYTGGDVTVGTALTSLTGITVTATYSDGTTKTVTGYSLSGEILEGENTITVSYGGKTTTITVTGVAESGGGDTTAELPKDGLLDFFDFRNVEPTINTTQGLTSYGGSNGGSLFAWSASIGNTSDDYGSTINRTLMYDKDGATTQTSLGQNVTFVVHGYFTSKSWIGMGHTHISNVIGVLCETYPRYVNTSGSTSNMPYNKSITETGLSYPQYINMIVSTDESNVYYYVNGELVATRSASEVEDFASWNNTSGLSITHKNAGVITALAIYDKTLSQVEVVETYAYCKTLEVA